MESFEIVSFNSLDLSVQNVILEAAKIREHAYCPYSNFAVGSAILGEDIPKLYNGANIENAALSPSICAERSAICKAVNDGCRKFKMVAVVALQENSFTAPCGVCRQTMSEFRSSSGDLDIYLAKPAVDQVLKTTLSQLLPLAFLSFR